MLGGILTDTRLWSMLEKGYDASVEDSAGSTALHFAAWKGNMKAASALLKSFDARDSENHEHMRPADIATSQGFGDLTKLLLGGDDDEGFGKRCRYVNISRKTILKWAIMGNCEKLISVLLSVDGMELIHVMGDWHEPAIHLAASHSTPQVLKFVDTGV